MADTEHLLLLIHSAFLGTASVASFVSALQGLCSSLSLKSGAAEDSVPEIIQTQPELSSRGLEQKVTPEEAALLEEEENEEKLGFSLKQMLLLSVTCLCVFVIAAFAVGFLYNSGHKSKQTAQSADQTMQQSEQTLKQQPVEQEQPSTDADEKQDAVKVDEAESEIIIPQQTGAKVEMPKLEQLSKEMAEKYVLASGLKYQYWIEVNDAPSGTVFKQEPEAGTELDRGTSITFWVSK